MDWNKAIVGGGFLFIYDCRGLDFKRMRYEWDSFI